MIHTLQADSIRLEFNNRVILSDVYIKCETGKITGLLGRNGEGKSCLMKIICGDMPVEKSVRFDGISQVKAFTKPELLVYLPQFNFIPARLSLKKIFRDFDLDYSSFRKRFPEFESRQHSSIRDLSGGERRLVELYVVLKSNAWFAMLDEPFTHLNPIQIENVKALLQEEKNNKGLLITDHMFRHITDISDSLYILANGKTHLAKDMNDIEKLGYARL